MLQDNRRFLYRQLEDTREHLVKQGDTLWTLAAKYFEGLPMPALLYWIIADFQPDPIHDPTVSLAPGRILYIPSLRTVTEQILSERRRATGE